MLRALIDQIELDPRDSGKGVDAVLHGDLAQNWPFETARNPKEGSPERRLRGVNSRRADGRI